MSLPPKPGRTKWSETDSYLHALVRELKDRLDSLQEYVDAWSTGPWESAEVVPDPRPSPSGYSFVFTADESMALFCYGTLHVFMGGDAMCRCGFVPRPE